MARARTARPVPEHAFLLWLKAGCMVVGVALGSCTLTEDAYEPTLVESGPLQPDASPPGDPQPGASQPEPSAGGAPLEPEGGIASCRTPADCEPGFACSDAVCVPSPCLGVEDPSGCIGELCPDGRCAPAHCLDAAAGGGETGVDCGGECAPCADGVACGVGSDCASGVCNAGACAAPSCSDGLVNQDESGPDCGGSSCDGCASGAPCARDSDCAAGLTCTAAGGVCSPPSCQDGLLNGVESAVDCGGGACSACSVGSACSAALDCESGVCVAALCAEATCTDAVKNGGESDVDCGGACEPCAARASCVSGADCESSVCGAGGCAAGVVMCCQAPSCADGVQNGDEAAVDCASEACGACALGALCSAAVECATNVCEGGTCQALCADGARNGDESDVDCGGSETGCPACEDGQGCVVGADCESGRCQAGACVSCADGVANGDEQGVDCGGSEPGCPACIRCDEQSSLDLGPVGTVTSLPANGCGQISQFPGYAPTIVEGIEAGPYPVPFSWRQPCTGQAGAGVFESAFVQHLLAGLGTGCPVIFTFDGAPELFGFRWF